MSQWHSDQGSQFRSEDWPDFLGDHNLRQSLSRRGHRHDKVAAESFFQRLKSAQEIRRREEAKQDGIDYIEMSYNPERCHCIGNDLSPLEYESSIPAARACPGRS